MNQPTREEFEAFKQEIRQEVRQLKEQRTEEMKAVRVDVHNVDVEAIRQELKTVSDTWLETLQDHYNEHHADILALQESQADLRDTLVSHGELLKNMATKGELTAMEARINGNITAMKAELLEAIRQQRTDS